MQPKTLLNLLIAAILVLILVVAPGWQPKRRSWCLRGR